MSDNDHMYADLVAALCIIDNPNKDGSNPHFRSRYATLEGCLDAAKAALKENNLALTQQIHPEPDRLVTRLIHTSGEFIEDGGVPLKPRDPTNPQALASAVTYARRYGLMAMLGITGEDDDGNAASKPPPSDMTPPMPKPPLEKSARKPDATELSDEWKAYIGSATAAIQKAQAESDLISWYHDQAATLAALDKEHPEQTALLRKEYKNKSKELNANA